MANQAKVDLFHSALNFGLQFLGLGHLQLKEKQYEVLKHVVLNNRDVLAVLPTGYGKSLIYQMLPPVLNFVDFGAEEKKATVIVISPLNALIRDQIVKMRESGLSVCVLRGDRVDTEDGGDEEISLEVPVEMLTSAHFDLIFTHPEGLVDKNKVSKSLKTTLFKEKINNTDPSADDLRNNIITEAIVSSLTTLDNKFSLPCAVDYATQKGKTGEAMANEFETHLKTVQTCEACQRRTPGQRNILKLENIRCESFCNVCYEKKDVWKECLEKGHISYVPSLRCWGHCLDNGLICTTFDSA